MKQSQFETQYTLLWSEIELILLEKSTQQESLPALYRRLCQSLALALQRGYSPALTDYLQKMVFDCHKKLYGTVVERPILLRHWMGQEFPRLVRAEWRLLSLTMGAFFGVAILVGLLVWFQPYLAYSFCSPQQLDSFRQMYQPGAFSSGRGAEGDVVMFGTYIWNNVSIGFRTVAGGIFGGIPALISLLFNGMQFGVVASWLSKDVATRNTFWSFVITHSSFEVTGLLLSGLAGMRLGLSFIHPGRLSRPHALFATSRRMFPMIVGAALLTVLAAFFEAFWSANASVSTDMKYAVGSVCWLLVIVFFVFAGRSKH
jgi:uncharacterized membrane protein SpoIIM required for sporulation